MQVGNSDNLKVTAESLNDQQAMRHPMTTNKKLISVTNSIKLLVGKLGTFIEQLKTLPKIVQSFPSVRSSMFSSFKEDYPYDQEPLRTQSVLSGPIKINNKNQVQNKLQNLFLYEKENRRFFTKKDPNDATKTTDALKLNTVAEINDFLDKWDIDSNAPSEIQKKFNDLKAQAKLLQEPNVIEIPKKEVPVQALPKNPSKIKNEEIRESIRTLPSTVKATADDLTTFLQNIQELHIAEGTFLNRPQDPARLLVYIQQWKDTTVPLNPEYVEIEQDLKNMLQPNADRKVIQAELEMISRDLKARDNKSTPSIVSHPSLLASDIKDTKSLKNFFAQCQPKDTASLEVKARFEKLKQRANELI